MKKNAIVLLLLFAGITSAFVMSDNGKAGYTNSPGENTCTNSGCHTGNTLNSTLGSVVITAPTMTNWQYVPGQTYPISVTVTQQGRSLFGFGFEALQSSGASAGTCVMSNSTQTQLKNASVNGNVRVNVVHKLNAGASSNTHTFTFNWTAPMINPGAVTFYAAGNAANGDGNETGDYIYTTTRAVSPVTTGIASITGGSGSFDIFPNPVPDDFNVNYILSEPAQIEINVLNAEGKRCVQLFDGSDTPGNHERHFSLAGVLKPGMYFMEVRENGVSNSKKILML